MGTGHRVLGTGDRTPDTQHRIPGTGNKALGTECQALSTGHQILGTGHGAPGTGHGAPGTGLWASGSGCWEEDRGYQALDTGHGVQGTEHWERGNGRQVADAEHRVTDSGCRAPGVGHRAHRTGHRAPSPARPRSTYKRSRSAVLQMTLSSLHPPLPRPMPSAAARLHAHGTPKNRISPSDPSDAVHTPTGCMLRREGAVTAARPGPRNHDPGPAVSPSVLPPSRTALPPYLRTAPPPAADPTAELRAALRWKPGLPPGGRDNPATRDLIGGELRGRSLIGRGEGRGYPWGGGERSGADLNGARRGGAVFRFAVPEAKKGEWGKKHREKASEP